MHAGVRVSPLTEHAPGRDSQAGLLEHLPGRGGLRALSRLDLPAGQHTRRGAVIGPAAHHQDAAMVDDNRDGDGLGRPFWRIPS